MKRIYALVLLGVATLGQAAGRETSAPLLHRDPFARPQTAQAAVQASAQNAPAPWTGQLRMTLRAGRQSMVNVDGKSVPLGGKFDGYTLVAVDERSARFSRDGRTITVGLDDDPRATSTTPSAP